MYIKVLNFVYFLLTKIKKKHLSSLSKGFQHFHIGLFAETEGFEWTILKIYFKIILLFITCFSVQILFRISQSYTVFFTLTTTSDDLFFLFASLFHKLTFKQTTIITSLGVILLMKGLDLTKNKESTSL